MIFILRRRSVHVYLPLSTLPCVPPQQADWYTSDAILRAGRVWQLLPELVDIILEHVFESLKNVLFTQVYWQYIV